MKRIIIASALTLLVAPAFAADPVEPVVAETGFSGYIEGFVGGLYFPDADEETYLTYGGAGRVNIPFASRFNAQLDIFGQQRDIDEAEFSTIGGAAHLYFRNDGYALGVFGSYQQDGLDFDGGSADFDNWKVGPEAQVYLGNVTLYGQAYYGQFDLSDIAPIDDQDLYGVRGVVRYFATPNLKFEGNVGYETLDIDVSDDSIDLITAGLTAMYRFNDSPISVFGRYQYETIDLGSSSDIDSHLFAIGLRASFGTDTLLDEDRKGATMDTLQRNLGLTLF